VTGTLSAANGPVHAPLSEIARWNNPRASGDVMRHVMSIAPDDWPDKNDPEKKEMWAGLLEPYCELDTLSMVLILEHWRRSVGLA
jgi:hypothetical protein